MHTQDIADTNVEKIGKLFPDCLTEMVVGKDENGKDIIGKGIDFDKLRQELSKGIVEGTQERFQFTWPGKREAIRIANTPTNMTLRGSFYGVLREKSKILHLQQLQPSTARLFFK